MTREIIYLGDPMCSWCWGFAPVMEKIREVAEGQATVRLVLGGLRAGETRALSEKDKEAILHHWKDVHTMTGQPFDFAFFEQGDFVYNTEPSSRAVVVMRQLHPAQTFNYLNALHRAFYAEGRDITQKSVLIDVAEEFGVAPELFAEKLSMPETWDATREDFSQAFQWGIRGFPTVLLLREQHYMALTMGYQSFDILEGPLKAWLNGSR